MKNIKLLLVAMLMCMVTNGMAQEKNTPDTKRAYYIREFGIRKGF